MTVLLKEPEFIRQKKLNSCWFACLKMLLQWHEGNRSIGNKEVSELSSWWEPRSFSETPKAYLDTRNIKFENQDLGSAGEIENELLSRGPFVGGGKLGKILFGPRLFGHAILIYGVNASKQIVYHDPMAGPGKTLAVDKYITLQDGERLHYLGGRVSIAARGN